jgi:uncharacterized membrane protein
MFLLRPKSKEIFCSLPYKMKNNIMENRERWDVMIYSLPELIFLFFIYSFVGWLWETVYCSILDKHFTYRGFLAGPYCPVYGFAVTTVLIFTEPIQDNLLILFLGGIVIATAFEYIAAWFLETFFHMKLWDYSHEFGNIKGRIAPKISLFWGIGIVVLVHFVQPHLMALILKVNDWWALFITIVMAGDATWTITDTASFQKTALAFEIRIEAEKKRISQTVKQEESNLVERVDLFSQRLAQFRLHIDEFFKENDIKPFRFNQRRLLKNYSKMSLRDTPILTEFRRQFAVFKNRKKN